VAQDTDLTGTGEVLGSAAYMSPEQAMGRPASPAADRYALAVVAYELLTGTRPFAGENPAALAHAHATASPPPPSQRADDLPASADRALLRGLDKDPSRRWPRAGAMIEALGGALDGVTAAAAETAPTVAAGATAATARVPTAKTAIRLPSPRRARTTRRRALAIVAALAVLALVGALASASGDTLVDPHATGQANLAPPQTRSTPAPPPTGPQPPLVPAKPKPAGHEPKHGKKHKDKGGEGGD
jgi:serine/threonine-protein kinase